MPEETASTNRRKNIYVLGYDERHSADLLHIPDVDRFNFYSLLRSEEVVYQDRYDIEDKLNKARQILHESKDPVDGIVCHWDFPATSMMAILCQEFGLLSPTLEAVLKCSHKYWSRIEQQNVVPENTPRFCAVDPFSEDPLEMIDLEYPFWIKPIKAYGSALGFRINNEKDFNRALKVVRKNIKRIGEPFNMILDRLDLPEEIDKVRGNYLIAEELIHGIEIAPEGSVQHGDFKAHGMIDMVRDKNQKSFLRYEYPSQAPKEVQQRAINVAEKLLKHIGFDNGCFNMEFFWNEKTDDLWIIEINPRISQSHSYQFEKVDGMSNHEIAVHVALGDQALFHHGGGPYKHAAKCFLRYYTQADAIVKRTPNKEILDKIKKKQPDTKVLIKLKAGQKLSTLKDQDAYSYVLAEIHVAGQTTHEMIENYREAVSLLSFDLEDIQSTNNDSREPDDN